MSLGNTDEYGSTKIRIPYFDPDKPTITAKAWIQFVELARKSAGVNKYSEKKGGEGEDKDNLIEKSVSKWTDDQTCTNAMLMLQGAGSRWIENILETNGPEMSSCSHTSSVGRFSENIDDKVVTYLIFFILMH